MIANPHHSAPKGPVRSMSNFYYYTTHNSQKYNRKANANHANSRMQISRKSEKITYFWIAFEGVRYTQNETARRTAGPSAGSLRARKTPELNGVYNRTRGGF